MKESGRLFRWGALSLRDRYRLILVIAGACIFAYLIFAPKPWSVQFPQGDKPPSYDFYVKIYSWWGAAIALGGTLLLLVTARLWTHPWQTLTMPAALSPRWFWPLVAIAMLLAAGMGSMRLGQDLWDDERTTLQRFVQGNYKPNDDGTVRFREFGFGRTLHDYYVPNNHVLHSVLARASVSMWRVFRSPDGLPFSETALRLPAFLFGIASVAALALLLKELGFARAGVIGAFLLAIHPWHIRYASEARGYALVLCLLPLLIVCWIRALRSGAWKWWIAVAGLQFCLLYSYPATVYPVAAINAATLVLILAGIPGIAPRAVLFARWLVPCFVAALTFVWLFLPCVPQLQLYLATERAQGTMGDWWLRDFYSHLFAGCSWFKSHDLNSPRPELYAMLTMHPRTGWILVWAALVLGMAGTLRLALRGIIPSLVAALLLLPAAASYWVALRGGSFLHEWYLIYLLPGVVAVVALGLDGTGMPWQKSKWSTLVPIAATVLFATGYISLTSKARNWLLTRPLQPMRESVALTRPSIMPNYEGYRDVVTASFNTPPYIYDPHVVVLRSPAELIALMKDCAANSKPLYLNVGNPSAAAVHHPQMFAMLNDPSQFEIIAELPGFDPTLDRIVARQVAGY